MSWKTKRTKPYFADAIKRLPCIRCGGKGNATWQICADKNYYRVLCKACDIDLNRLVLEWATHPEKDELMRKYIAKALGEQ